MKKLHKCAEQQVQENKMTQYGPEFFRKFADIITEAEQVPQVG